ncbi:hypothetical protein HAZT_HAZT007056 [Hyalella azteca]|uniref:Uncharacterized protein n=1 Tax=Hyalella azteca TaxID=294128 RepID=A0A6A0HE00_HYAAZ|nr:hypothetical protein HAZT_HAZT007056 [Hyalella azteca]
MSKRKHNPTGVARRLVRRSKLSSHGAAVVCHQLSDEDIEISAPCQSAIHKAIYTRAAQVKKDLVSTLHLEKWSINFDGKHIKGFEYQSVFIMSLSKAIKLTVLNLRNGKAEGLQEQLQKDSRMCLRSSICEDQLDDCCQDKHDYHQKTGVVWLQKIL